VSRYLDQTLRSQLETITEIDEVPCVRGRAVLDPATLQGAPVLLGWPNAMGRFDGTHPDAETVAIVDSALARSVPVGHSSFVGSAGDPDEIDSAVSRAGRLAKRLNQIHRVVSAHGSPEAPVFVVLLPLDPMTIGLPSGATSLHGRFAELPGGLRIDAGEIADDDIASYAATLEAELGAKMSGRQP
jgi:hypothetical protein